MSWDALLGHVLFEQLLINSLSFKSLYKRNLYDFYWFHNGLTCLMEQKWLITHWWHAIYHI